MTFWICLALWCLILSISIFYAPKSDIRVKSYDHMSFSRASVVQFWASRYIIGLNRTSESKLIAVWICLALWCLISGISRYYAPESDILVKRNDNLNLSRASALQFQASRYINGLNWTSEPKVMDVGICLAVSCLISSVSIYFWP